MAITLNPQIAECVERATTQHIIVIAEVPDSSSSRIVGVRSPYFVDGGFGATVSADGLSFSLHGNCPVVVPKTIRYLSSDLTRKVATDWDYVPSDATAIYAFDPPTVQFVDIDIMVDFSDGTTSHFVLVVRYDWQSDLTSLKSFINILNAKNVRNHAGNY